MGGETGIAAREVGRVVGRVPQHLAGASAGSVSGTVWASRIVSYSSSARIDETRLRAYRAIVLLAQYLSAFISRLERWENLRREMLVGLFSSRQHRLPNLIWNMQPTRCIESGFSCDGLLLSD